LQTNPGTILKLQEAPLSLQSLKVSSVIIVDSLEEIFPAYQMIMQFKHVSLQILAHAMANQGINNRFYGP
jgi:hypothetical protein